MAPLGPTCAHLISLLTAWGSRSLRVEWARQVRWRPPRWRTGGRLLHRRTVVLVQAPPETQPAPVPGAEQSAVAHWGARQEPRRRWRQSLAHANRSRAFLGASGHAFIRPSPGQGPYQQKHPSQAAHVDCLADLLCRRWQRTMGRPFCRAGPSQPCNQGPYTACRGPVWPAQRRGSRNWAAAAGERCGRSPVRRGHREVLGQRHRIRRQESQTQLPDAPACQGRAGGCSTLRTSYGRGVEVARSTVAAPAGAMHLRCACLGLHAFCHT